MNTIQKLAQPTASSTQIPILDLHNLTADRVLRAIQEVGCFYLKNCVSQNAIDQAFAHTNGFFALPELEKRQLAWKDGAPLGYFYSKYNADFREAFVFGEAVLTDKIYTDSTVAQQVHQHLRQHPAFCDAVQQLFIACHNAGNSILKAIALALNLPESYFSDRHPQQADYGLLHRYYEVSEPPQPGEARFEEHTDWGSLSLLFQDENGGLEICTNAGEWIAAPPLPNSAIVFIADVMQRWTNDKLPATKHRVLMPANVRSLPERYSLVFFLSPGDDTEIACIETCLDAGESPKYPPILTKEFYKQKTEDLAKRFNNPT
ncbi:isopenicillin N synthase family oxygenase [Nostoc sp. FACHB-152]|uniref:isopenicillin N synthase family dioxygenase n=1 Tax=unclassified Nostoc TaxID=2593658 RepID=UPI001685CDF2|nr:MULTISPECIES: isopenicillin N synthase family oxygenase [unclassified Nostoc]MBD2446895.1 isopenicillin N synthase family oxygenase [Nostoc sp. FACHB-152]MBD2467768.1 isopenicillin N synthase family oxygenase [Nostoc sp. FACHB-145]